MREKKTHRLTGKTWRPSLWILWRRTNPLSLPHWQKSCETRTECVLEHEKCTVTKELLCFRTWNLVLRDVGEVQRGRRREDVVEVFWSGFFEAVEGGAWEVPRQRLLLLARPSTRQLHHWMFGQHHSNHVTMKTLAVQMTHRWWEEKFNKNTAEKLAVVEKDTGSLSIKSPQKSKCCVSESFSVEMLSDRVEPE